MTYGHGATTLSESLPDRRTTLAAIAERAHVSIGTVSKVVNERTGVGEETRARVREVIAELGYLTHAERQLSAAQLAEPTFELLVDPFDERNPYMFSFLGGATEASGDLGAALVTRRLDSIARMRPNDWARSLAAHHRAGVIEVTTRYSAGRERALRAVGLPMVLVDPIDFPRTATMSIGATNWAGAYEATTHLLELGHTRIAYIGGPVDAACDIARASGWAAAMSSAGHRVDVDSVRRDSYSFEHGLAVATDLLRSLGRPTAIFAGADITAMGVLEAARRLHISVPDDLSVVGFDDTVLARSASPNLTTVHQPIADIGRTAVSALLRLARGEAFATKRVELATHLVVRDSTAPPAGRCPTRPSPPSPEPARPFFIAPGKSTMTLSHPPLPARGTDATARARAMLARMTLEEKIAQLGSSWPGSELAEGDVAPMQETHVRAQPFDDAVVDGLGQLTRVYGTAPVSAAEGRARLDRLQAAVVAGNRWGIPAIAHEECLTGVTAWGATVYPTPLAWAASFDPDTVRAVGERIGSDLRRLGVHQGLAPVLDVVRDYRWGRVEETMGEDPHVVAEIGTAYVEGVESSGTIATPKHFAGYAASRGARNHAPVSIGPREFADVILPPFERALQTARSVMNSYTDVDGVPAAADASLFTGLLRERWGFEGTVVSDYWAIPFLHTMHRVAADEDAAGILALQAGIDVELPHRMSFLHLAQAVRDGLVSEAFVDRAAERVLRQKIELELFDPAGDRADDVDLELRDLIGEDEDDIDLDSADNRLVARTLAERSIVLLRNEGVLPLADSARRVAVIGPTADDSACLFGCYSFPNHVLVHHPDTPLGVAAPTYLDALFESLDDAEIVVAAGTSVRDGETEGIAEAVAVAADADMAIVFVGDRSGMFGLGTSGEGCDVATLDLPGAQQLLVDAVLDTATPVILVVSSGRPYALGRAVEEAAAIVQVFLPGQEGGLALADVLTGRVNPSGRLPVQIPTRHAPQPGTYLAPPLALRSDGVSNLDPSPAFAFGHGLSYTTFERRIVDVTATADTDGGEVALGVEVRNSGSVDGAEVVQVYVSVADPSVVQPLRRLVAFHRVDLAAGDSTVVEFHLPVEAFAYTGAGLTRAVEPGAIRLHVAASAAEDGVACDVELVGGVAATPTPRRRFARSRTR